MPPESTVYDVIFQIFPFWKLLRSSCTRSFNSFSAVQSSSSSCWFQHFRELPRFLSSLLETIEISCIDYCHLSVFYSDFHLDKAMPKNRDDFFFKVVLIGDVGVGKSSIFKRYRDGVFFENLSGTVGLDHYAKSIEVGRDREIKVGVHRFNDFALKSKIF